MPQPPPPTDPWQFVDAFLAIVDGAGPASPAEEQALVDALDGLVAALAGVALPDDARDVEARDEEAWEALYQRVGLRFPDHGYYVTSARMEPGGNMPSLVGDAIDDIADISRDLRRARWLRTHKGEAEGLWALVDSHWMHWRHHARELLAYLDLHRTETRGLWRPGHPFPEAEDEN